MNRDHIHALQFTHQLIAFVRVSALTTLVDHEDLPFSCFLVKMTNRM